MGTKAKRSSGLGEALFSKTQRQILGLLFGVPDRSYYSKEIVRHAGVGSGSVQRELERLSRVGILTTERIGNQKHFRANKNSPIFEELRGIVVKTFGVGDVLRRALEGLSDRISVAFIYGSVAQGIDRSRSDIDLMIVSDKLSYADVMKTIAEAETRLGRTVNPTVYKPAEFRKKVSEGSGFLRNVEKQPKIFLFGTADDLPEPR